MRKADIPAGFVPCGDKRISGKPRAVICSDGSVPCKISGKHIALNDGTVIAEYDKQATADLAASSASDEARVRVYTGASPDGSPRSFTVSCGKVYYGGEFFGDIETHMSRVPAAMLAVAAVLVIAMVVVIAMLASAPENIYPDFVIRDNGSGWGAEGDMQVFGDGKLSPGSKGEYHFVIENPNDVQLVYELRLYFTYEGEEAEFPLAYTLKMNNAEIRWTEKNGAELVVGDIKFASRSSQLFTLCWEWPFDGADDELDSMLGNSAGKYDLHISVTAQVA